jgi:trehalose synthase
MAGDDPEGYRILSQVNKESGKDADIHVFTNLSGVGNMEVNAFQRTAQVVVQKSIKEGFGLVVSESLWKETPVVAGKVGGIPLQVPEGNYHYLVSSIAECADKVLALLRNESERREYGKKGKELIRRKFLTPRLVRDELNLIKSLISS